MRRLILLLSFLIAACTPRTEKNNAAIRIKGSDTMIILVRYWAEAYMTINPDVSVYVEGGGSATGLSALIAGNIDIAMTSRLIRPEEAGQMARTYKSIGISYLVAKDALSIYLNPENPVKGLTIPQLKGIFNGTITNWQEIGGIDAPTIPVIRPVSSGTFLYFKNNILEGGEYDKDCIRRVTTRDVIHYVMLHPGAVGYGGIAYGDSVVHAAINNVHPTEENVLNDTYPISRYLYLYTVDTPKPKVRQFIDWITGPAGQAIVRQVGYIPLWATE